MASSSSGFAATGAGCVDDVSSSDMGAATPFPRSGIAVPVLVTCGLPGLPALATYYEEVEASVQCGGVV